MGIYITAQFLRDSRSWTLPDEVRLLGAYYALHADDDTYEVWAKNATLAAELNKTPRSISTSTTGLITANWLLPLNGRRRGQGQPTHYKFNLPARERKSTATPSRQLEIVKPPPPTNGHTPRYDPYGDLPPEAAAAMRRRDAQRMAGVRTREDGSPEPVYPAGPNGAPTWGDIGPAELDIPLWARCQDKTWQKYYQSVGYSPTEKESSHAN